MSSTMPDLTFLILLFHFNRPGIVLNALKSLRDQTYRNFEFVMIDDSEEPLGIVPFKLLETGAEGMYVHTQDTKQAKLDRGGSIFGKFANEATAESDADVCIMLCCDDFLEKDYLLNLNYFFNDNPEINYCYSDVVVYDPLTEKYEEVLSREVDNAFHLNSNKNPHCLGNSKDSSQVAWRTHCSTEGGCLFPWPLTSALDFHLYMQLYSKYGVGYYSGFTGQFKGWHDHQLGKTGSYEIVD